MFYLFAILFLTTVSGQTSNTGKIKNEPTDNSANSPSSGDQNSNYQYNQGIQPYSYGYNTGIRPYSYSYTQNGDKPQVTYHNLQQPMQQYSPQPMPGMVPFQPYYGNGAGYPMPMQYGYPPMQPMPYQPMPMNGSPQPTIPPIPDLTSGGLPNLGTDFDLSNLNTPQGKSNSAVNSNNPNNFEDFNMENLGQNDASNANSNNNNSPSTDLNSELANLADPSSVSGTNTNNKNNNANQALPTGLGDFNIDGLSSNIPANNNNNNNNAFSGLPQDILGQFNTNNNNKNANDFSDLSSLANLANNAGGSANPNTNQDFNFGGSNNNLDFDLNIPSASNIIEKALDLAKKDPKKIFSKKQINENLKKAVNKRLIKVIEKPINKQIDKLLKRKRRSISSLKAEESSLNESKLESPRKMLNLDPRHQNPYQGVYSKYFAY